MSNIPFQWEMRVSKRIKHTKIGIDEYGRVELVCPVKMSEKDAQDMLQQHTGWVLKQLAKRPQKKPAYTRPETIKLLAIERSFAVHYRATASRGIELHLHGDELNLIGAVDDPDMVCLALRSWLKDMAIMDLSIWLAEQAARMGLSYVSLTIRLQKRRWGSCSQAKRINLNAALLFLPKELVDHVLIHELTHLKHLNHSPSFWAEVAKVEPNYQENRKFLQERSSDVPLWVNQTF
ncbi:MAG: SprT family zinc-dependent metalloprotease [Ghiorsea sp.]